MRNAWVLAIALAGLVGIACGDEVNHGNLDEWKTTVKGPGKLKKALQGSYAADLKGHAAANLVLIGEWADAKATLERLDEGERRKIVGDLAPRLMKAATAPEGSAPSPIHASAKDALFDVRGWADDAMREQIDAYLADWVTVNYFDRSARGRVEGTDIVRAVGKRAAPKLLAEGRSILAAPPDAEGRIKMFSDELLLALAYSGDPEAAGFLIDVASVEHKEPTLQKRATRALVVAYVEDTTEPRPDGHEALGPHADKLARLVLDESIDGAARNNGMQLLAAAGEPECVQPLVSLVQTQNMSAGFFWGAVQQGLLCVGADGVAQIVEAMPQERPDYERGILEKYLWDKMRALDDKPALQKSARAMLESTSPLARVTGVELLSVIGGKEDAERVRALAGDKTVLRGWWGKQEGVPKKELKKDPPLGQIATEVAKKLESSR